MNRYYFAVGIHVNCCISLLCVFSDPGDRGAGLDAFVGPLAAPLTYGTIDRLIQHSPLKELQRRPPMVAAVMYVECLWFEQVDQTSRNNPTQTGTEESSQTIDVNQSARHPSLSPLGGCDIWPLAHVGQSVCAD